MEGIYKKLGTLPKEIVADIRKEKEAIRICSLSKTSEDTLMWAHYSDGERGVVIGINREELETQSKYSVREIDYDKEMTCVSTDTPVAEILTYKNKCWEYEQEVRIFSKMKFINVVIEKIILGSRISNEHEVVIRKLIEKVKLKIEIEKREKMVRSRRK